MKKTDHSISLKPLNQLARQVGFDILIIPVINKKLPLLPNLPEPLYEEIKKHASLSDLQVFPGSNIVFYPARNRIAERIMLWELGKDPFKVSEINSALKIIKSHISKYSNYAIVFPEKIDFRLFARQIAMSFLNFNLQSKEFKSSAKKSAKKKNLMVFSDTDAQAALKQGEVIGKALQLARRISNYPANFLTPTKLAELAQNTARLNKISAITLGEQKLRKLGMNGVLAVSQGSEQEAQLIILDYNKTAKKTIALVGKGITFDSGGISIKQSRDMDDMKFDMCGGADVLAIVQAAAELKIPYRIVGIIAASENLPSGSAMKPGDIITAYSGTTVEILNTDAEGRLVLADALTYAQKHYQPAAIIDIATLTSAVMTTFGGKYVAAFGNNSKFNSALEQAAQNSGEQVWFLPLSEKHRKELSGRTADLANIIKGRTADALTAPVFLENFIEKDTPWIHLDIAGAAWNNEGSTGRIIPTLVELLRSIKL